MYCPSCGIEDAQANQFCRSCGTDMRPVRTVLSRPDTLTEAGALARHEISRAIADKIREARSPAELAVVAENVVPEIEKFLESPAEKRLRRMRVGMIVTAAGSGAFLAMLFVSVIARLWDEDIVYLLGIGGIITMFIGIGLFLNGQFLTVPKFDIPDETEEADRQRELDSRYISPAEIGPAEEKSLFPSVTEHTTRSLDREP